MNNENKEKTSGIQFGRKVAGVCARGMAAALLLAVLWGCGRSEGGSGSAVADEGRGEEAAGTGVSGNPRGRENTAGGEAAVQNGGEASCEEAQQEGPAGESGGAESQQARAGAGDGTWKYNGDNFDEVFHVSPLRKEFEGVVYRHYGDPWIKVAKATEEGYLTGSDDSPDSWAWVETHKRYEEGEPLGGGFYVRRGLMDDEKLLGFRDEVSRYVEVEDEEMLAAVRQKVEEEEGTPFEVDAPVPSLCGFEIGATPLSTAHLFKAAKWDGDDTHLNVELSVPFRHCNEARLEFTPRPPAGGKHLSCVELSGEAPLETMAERREEVQTIVAMLEKKFGIEFVKTTENTNPGLMSFYYIEYEWEFNGGNDGISQSMTVEISGTKVTVALKSDLMTPREWHDWKESQKAPKLSSDAGADLL